MDKIKIGVVGVGYLGEIHLKTYKTLKNVEVVGIFDLDKKRASSIAGKYNINNFSSYTSLLKEIDAASIVVPTTLHFDSAKLAIKQGKHVLIEKPICSTLAEADELIHLALENKIIIQVGHIERFNPAFIALKGINLTPLFIEVHRLAPFNPRGNDVAVIQDLMIHDLDLILNLAAGEVIDIKATGVTIISNSIDIANVRLEFSGGCVANITASRFSLKSMRKMRIFQGNSYVAVDFLKKESEVYILVENEKSAHPPDLLISLFKSEEKEGAIIRKHLEISDKLPLDLELSSFIECIIEEKLPVVSAVDGKKALDLSLQILKIINS